MRYLLTIVFMLLAGTAWAGEFTVLSPTKDCPRPNCLAWSGPDIPPTNTDHSGKPRITLDHDCLAKMEQAMRAMDKSMPQFFRKIILSGRTYWEFTDQLTEAQAKAYWKMLDQWETAKADCWTTP